MLPSGSVTAWAGQLALMRAVSVMMALGTLVASYLCGVEMVGPRRAVFAPLALLLTPLFLYYGKMANLDVPALCWFAWAMVAFLRIRRAGRFGDYVWLGIASAGAVATKDQAYANLGLVGVAVIVMTARQHGGSASWGGLGRALADRRVWAAGAAAVRRLDRVPQHGLQPRRVRGRTSACSRRWATSPSCLGPPPAISNSPA